jgi:hypothetical protein
MDPPGDIDRGLDGTGVEVVAPVFERSREGVLDQLELGTVMTL